MNSLAPELTECFPPSLEWGAVFPIQLPSRGGLHDPPTGVPRLMCAILEDATHVYLRECGSTRQSRAFHGARLWIHSNDRKWVFSFLRICEALNLDPSTLRRRLHAQRADRPGSTRAA